MRLLFFLLLVACGHSQLTCGDPCTLPTGGVANLASTALVAGSFSIQGPITCASTIPDCHVTFTCNPGGTFNLDLGGSIAVAQVTINCDTVTLIGSINATSSENSPAPFVPTAASVGSFYSAGGGYGGDGGIVSSVNSPPPYWCYGSAINPSQVGQTGQTIQIFFSPTFPANATFPGGRAGGYVLIQSTVLNLLGSIFADGSSAPTSQDTGGSSFTPGSGSGGGIKISTSQATGGGSIFARGGPAITDASAGGGGRVSISANVNIPWAVDVSGGAGSIIIASGGPGTYYYRINGTSTLNITSAVASGTLFSIPATAFPPPADTGVVFQNVVIVNTKIRGSVVQTDVGNQLRLNATNVVIDNSQLLAGDIAIYSNTISLTQSALIDASATVSRDVPISLRPITTSVNTYGGGGYGGFGSIPDGGLPYGNPARPTDFGSPGFSITSAAVRKKAGGRVIIVASDLNLLGRISANGEPGARDGGAGYSSGASGGSILIQATNLIVGLSTTLAANGGDVGTLALPGFGSGAGSGGRVAVLFTTLSGVLDRKITVWPGRTGAANSTKMAGFGTIYILANASSTLYIGPNAIPTQFTAINPAPTGLDPITVDKIDWQTARITGMIKSDDPVVVTALSSISISGTVVVGSTIDLNSQGTMTIDSLSLLTVTGLGTSGTTAANGQGTPSSIGGGGGGGHGGRGGDGQNATGGFQTANVNAINPTTHGGAGGFSTGPLGLVVQGGRGGGNIKIVASGNLQLDAPLQAEGAQSVIDVENGTLVSSGAGAGGSIWIQAASISRLGSSPVAISVAGGSTFATAAVWGGHGAGGRISVISTSAATIPSYQFSFNGNFDGTRPAGGGGSLYIATPLNRTLYLRNPTAASLKGQTYYPPPPSGQNYTQVFAENVRLLVDNSKAITGTSRFGLDSASTVDVPQLSITTTESVDFSGIVTVDRLSITTGTFNLNNAIRSQDRARAISVGIASTGGSYGGAGGYGGDQSAVRGSSVAPAEFGQAGGSPTALGGGQVRISASTAINIFGTIDCAGQPGNSSGGSGGAIWLDTSSLNFSPSATVLFDAQGGAFIGTGIGGGGGGGRISLSFKRSTSVVTTKCSVRGGIGSSTTTTGGSGTLVLTDTTTSSPQRLLVVSDTSTQTAGTFLPDAAGSTYEQATITQARLIAQTEVRVGASKLITIDSSLLRGSKVTVSSLGPVTVINSLISTAALAPVTASPSNGGGRADPNAASGGGHGGLGGLGKGPAPITPGQASGNIKQPTSYGGAGGIADISSPTPFGGGVIRIQATTLSLGTSTLDASGSPVIEDTTGLTSSGGGAGGSIWISATVITGSPRILAVGGSAVATFASSPGGPGGGGRIAVEYTSLGFPISVFNCSGGEANAAGGANGGPGTVFLAPAGSPSTLYVTGRASAIGSTPLPDDVVNSFDNVIVSDALIVPRASLLPLVAGNVTLRNSLFQGQSISLNVTGTLSVDSTSAIDSTAISPQTTGTPATLDIGASHGGVASGSVVGTYGVAETPILPGSVGGPGVRPGLGGGVIYIRTGGLSLQGFIRADGGGVSAGGGGGSGGSIWLDLGLLPVTLGTGALISASGGAVSGTTGSPGAGGRIAIYYRNLPQNFDAQVAAYGGKKSQLASGAGTYYKQNLNTLEEVLIIDNGGSADDQSFTPLPIPLAGNGFSAVTIRGRAKVTASNCYVAVLTIEGVSFLQSASLLWPSPLNIRSFNITLSSSSTITAPLLSICTDSLQVDIGTRIRSLASGFDSTSLVATTAPTTAGSYGGTGATCIGGGTTVASTPGIGIPGGSGARLGAFAGGAGGGSMDINARLFTLNGVLLATGDSGVDTGGGLFTGSGAGGYISVSATSITGTGSINANGGSGGGAAGGGGVIVVNSDLPLPTGLSGLSTALPGTDTTTSCAGATVGTVTLNAGAVTRTVCSIFCARGQFTNLTSGTCEDCPPGNYASLGGSLTCTPCDPGSASGRSRTVTCPRCSPGSIAPSPGMTSCTLCGFGQEQPASGSTICIDCLAGQYSPVNGTPSCISCPAGNFSSRPASSACQPCLRGFYANTTGRTGCSQCDPGTYAPVGGLVNCLPCEAGTFIETPGQTSCTDCAAGSFAEPGASQCTPCTGAYYQPSPRSGSCLLCPPLTYVESPGATLLASCLPCAGANTSASNAQCPLWDIPSSTASVCSGLGLTFARAAPILNSFVCQIRTLGGQPVTDIAFRPEVSIGFLKRQGISITTTSLGSGSYNFSYTAPTVGNILISILMQGIDIPPSPLRLEVFPATQPVPQGPAPAPQVAPVQAPSTNSVPSAGSSSSGGSVVDGGDGGGGGGGSTTIIIAVVVVAAIIIIILIVVIVIVLKKRGAKSDNSDIPLNATGGERTEPPTAFQENTQVSASAQMYGKLPPPSAAFGGQGGVVKKAKSYEIPYDELELQEEIGRGAYGIVYRGKWRDSDVAVKQLVFSHNLPPDLAEKEMETFLAEAAILKNLRPHANVLLFYGITPIPNLCIITEFLPGGSLWSLLCSNQVIEWTTVIKILKGIAAGMRHLHTEGIVHRDLAARNILLTASNDPKVADFGLSRTYVESGDPQHTKSDVGPVKWMAPESIRDREYSTKSDVWSFAVVIYEVLTRSEPFAGLDPIQVATRVVYENMRVPNPENAPPYLAELMDSCLQQNAKARPEFREIVRKLDR